MGSVTVYVVVLAGDRAVAYKPPQSLCSSLSAGPGLVVHDARCLASGASIPHSLIFVSPIHMVSPSLWITPL